MHTKIGRKYSATELFQVACYGAILLWVNLYIGRDFFTAHTAHMNSMHGFWIALAKRGGDGFFRPSWWPYWDCGIPFEAAYQPLIPGLTAAWAAIGSIPHDQAFGCVTGFFYCLGPLALFVMAWAMTRLPGASFCAALFYSLTSITAIVLPDDRFRPEMIWQARRLYLAALWDETPHLGALSLLPLFVLCLVFAIERRGRVWYAGAAAILGLMTVASAFGPVEAAMAAVCLLFVLRREQWKSNLLLVAGIGAYGYVLAMGFVPPSVWRAIHDSAGFSQEEKWSLGSLTALAVLIAGWAVLWQLLERWVKDWRSRFFALFAWLTCSIPFTADILHRRLMPQPGRYKLEFELAVALAICFGARHLLARMPSPVRRAAILLFLALGAEQVARYRQLEKQYLAPQDVTGTVEYRAALWAGHNLRGVRVLFPGSVAQWANDFSTTLQFSGGTWSMATNRSQQKAQADIIFGSGPKINAISLTWLKAYGVGAVAVSAPHSQEYWKPYADPSKFDALPVLWSEGGVSIHAVPLRSTSLAHIVPVDAVVRHPPQNPEDIGETGKYAAALADTSLPPAELEWPNRNQIRIRTHAAGERALSVQVGYHPGWHALVNGHRRTIYKDGLGLMWLRPECSGPCEIDLSYDGGWGLWMARLASYAALAALAIGGTLRVVSRLARIVVAHAR